MPKKYFKPPKEVIKEWPEVFNEIYMDAMPVKYITGVELTFNDGRIWAIDLSELSAYEGFVNEDEILERLSSSIGNFDDEISSVNFQVDIDRLKEDVLKSTKNIMDKK